MSKTIEQDVRDMLARAGVRDAQHMTSGSLAELANVLADSRRLLEALREMNRHANVPGGCECIHLKECYREVSRLLADALARAEGREP